MGTTSPTQLSDRDLLAEARRVVESARRTTAELLALLAEIDTRKLYLGEGHSSLFTYCTHVLHLSEPAAYNRITAARAARRFPAILPRLADGAVTLTTVSLLAAHLTEENHEALLDAARHESKRDVERLVAALDPRPDEASSVRKVRAQNPTRESALNLTSGPATAPAEAPAKSVAEACTSPTLPLTRPSPAAPRSCLAPLAPERYLVKFTVGQDTYDKLQRARDLMRHTVPNGDPAAIVDRALTVLIAELEKTKHAAARRPRASAAVTSASRYVPAAVKRVVWARDEARCAFVGSGGRCRETGFLGYHHLVPFAAGGATSVENLQLRCRAHNAHEAERHFGRRGGPTLSGQSSPQPVVKAVDASLDDAL